ncbi:MAG: PBP1A family penicillin-binding protein [Deltaproteobacteria bacterium]|nr:PBP1A family penicillin-binding protein [Deltaproteobacteria bacterium]
MAFFRSRGFRILLAAAFLSAVVGLAGAFLFYRSLVADLPDLRDVRDYEPALTSRVFDRDGRPIGEYYVERRSLAPMDEIPDHVVQAFIASEDSAFFEHAGIDYVSILRAAWVNLAAGGETRQGASTITQQMVKGLLLTPERTYKRKIREMILARRIEKTFSKQEILYLYLNQIYFGHGAYGVGEAARTYFGKTVGELGVSEAALLAGLPKAPSRYSPMTHPEAAEKRRQYVLARMLADDMIDQASYDAAAETPPILSESRDFADAGAAGYFTEEVRRALYEEFGSDLVLRGGLTIETTLDLELQEAAVAAVRKGILALDRRQGYRGPLRRVEPSKVEAEAARLAETNGLDTQALDPTDDGTLALDALDDGPLAADTLYEGVVTSVTPSSKSARVKFAPDVEAVVLLSDASWAREPDLKSSPRRVRAIETIFAVGDVAKFERHRPKQDEAPAQPGDPLRVDLFQAPVAQSALLSIETASDEVLAMVGGYDFAESEFNRVTQARRQPGSAFKPLIYSAALMHGYTPASILYDRPVVYVDDESGFVWRPRNYKGKFLGPITMRSALARSVNNATVHLFRDVGVDVVIDYVRMLGIQSPLNRDLSLALGSSPLSLFELTRAYAVYANGGRRSAPTFIRKVSDRNGEVLLENLPLGGMVPPTPDMPDDSKSKAIIDVAAAADSDTPVDPMIDDPDQLISPELAYLSTSLLRAVVEDLHGTGRTLRVLNRPLAGKTGTTNEQADAWFVGYSPDIVTGVWVGHDETNLLGYKETGGRAAAPIWIDYMREAMKGRRIRDFDVPDPIVFARIDRKTGLLASPDSRGVVFEAFLPGTAPTRSAEVERTTQEGRRLLRMDDF